MPLTDQMACLPSTHAQLNLSYYPILVPWDIVFVRLDKFLSVSNYFMLFYVFVRSHLPSLPDYKIQIYHFSYFFANIQLFDAILGFCQHLTIFSILFGQYSTVL